MTKKINSAKRVSDIESVFKCPLCESSMWVVELKSLVCTNNHTFDFANQGYLNLMNHPANSHYRKELFESRHKIIMESHLYASVHERISRVIKEHMNISTNPFMVADLGCGEGSHLQKILDRCRKQTMTGVGLDISKEGIVMASKRYDKPIWLVGDLAKLPLEDQSFQVILNILSPSNYKEFKRILVQDGLVIKVVPRPHYLKELREMLLEKKNYKNDETVSLFKQHFHLLNVFSLRYTTNLKKAELPNLVQMTPLAWSADKSRIDEFLKRDSAKITVDLDILVGLKK